MKLFVCLFALYAAANAGFIGLGGGHGPGHDHGYTSHSHGGHAKVIKVKVINEDHGHHQANYAAPQIIKVIQQQSSSFPRGISEHRPVVGPRIVKIIHQDSAPVHSADPQVIKVIHQQADSSRIGSQNYDQGLGSALGPVSAPAQVIKVIHENSASSSGSAVHQQISSPAKLIRVIHEHIQGQPIQGSFTASDPPKVIRVIHEQAQAPQSTVQAGSFTNSRVVAPDNNYLPPVQAPPQAFSPPVQQYEAPSSQIPASSQYLPPLPQYSAPPPTFIAPEPVPVATHIPAQSYGPPN